MTYRLLVMSVAALALAACQREADNQLAELSGRLFVFNYRVGSANYVVTLRRTARFPDGGFAEAEFENPMGGAPLMVRQKLFPPMDRVVLESPDLRCVKKDKPYSVTITLFGPDARPLQTISTSVTSTVDQSAVLPSKPLVVGPVYTPNPEVFQSDGAVDYAKDAGCPS